MNQNTSLVEKYYRFKAILKNGQWLQDAYVGIDEKGTICFIGEDTPEDFKPVEDVNGIALPGFYNAHSHAFQYAMAGMAEIHRAGTNDDFWSWREAMYLCALSLDPDQVQTIATALYIEMLRKGYTHVCEFQYLHHDKNGKPYTNSAEISVSLLAAAATAGIRITIIPVFYQKGGFGKEAQTRQRRFIFRDVDEYFDLLQKVASVAKQITTAHLGYGVHSLRAADVEDLKSILSQGPSHLPFHIHAAEQLKEIEDCVGYLKQRPVEWLVNNVALDGHFNLVHCTHMTDDEINSLAKSGANVVLCPGTEANLGDGIFSFSKYVKQQGNWCIGTDSHISLNPLEDLRWLDYAQRLTTHKRNTLDDGGRYLLMESFRSGSRAAGVGEKDPFSIGQPFDAAVFDADTFLFSDINKKFLTPRILFNADSSNLAGTIVNGNWIVRNQFHQEQKAILTAFKKVIRTLTFD